MKEKGGAGDVQVRKAVHRAAVRVLFDLRHRHGLGRAAEVFEALHIILTYSERHSKVFKRPTRHQTGVGTSARGLMKRGRQ